MSNCVRTNPSGNQQLVSYPLSYYHDLETDKFETGYGGYSPRDEVCVVVRAVHSDAADG